MKSSYNSYKFHNMGNKPLAYPVARNNKVFIPAGTTGVKIAFRQSPFFYFNEETGRKERMNVYLYKGRIYHG